MINFVISSQLCHACTLHVQVLSKDGAVYNDGNCSRAADHVPALPVLPVLPWLYTCQTYLCVCR